MIQRFQESQLNSLQVTQKLIEANHKWHESTKEMQKDSKSKLDQLSDDIHFKIENLVQKQENILQVHTEDMQCKVIDLKSDVNQIIVKLDDVLDSMNDDKLDKLKGIVEENYQSAVQMDDKEKLSINNSNHISLYNHTCKDDDKLVYTKSNCYSNDI